MRKPRIGRAHRRDQRRHHFRLDPIREVPGIGNIGKAAPTVRDFLILRENIGDERKGPQILLECLGERLRSHPARLLARVLQQIESRLDRKRPAADLETQAGNGLVE